MKHKNKIKLARRLRNKSEMLRGVGVFDSKEWLKRKAIRNRSKTKKKYE